MEERETKRASARAETIGLVLRSIGVAAVWILALFMMLGQLDIDLAPLIAGAGIGGLALGFGAQSIVKDFLSGLFMLIEDQYGVGDIVDVGSASGTVEKVSLRSTTIRDVKGTVWHVPNGVISRVGNSSQLWSRAFWMWKWLTTLISIWPATSSSRSATACGRTRNGRRRVDGASRNLGRPGTWCFGSGVAFSGQD